MADRFWADDPELRAEAEALRQQHAEAERERYRNGQDHEATAIDLAAGGIMQKISWVWPGWLARGKLHILGGQKGAGKSTIAFDLLAQITSGGKFRDGTAAPLGDVLIWSGEDDMADTILPRAAVAGADINRIRHISSVTVGGVKRTFDPAADMELLVAALDKLPDLAAVLVDPVVSVMAGDSHKNAETRRGLQPLVNLAIRRNIVLLGITHFTKNTQGRDPIERITGSLAFGAIPRIVMAAAKGETEDAPRRFVRIASNIGNSGGGYEYMLRQDLVFDHDFTAQRVVWGQYLDGSPLALLENIQDQKTKQKQAAELLTVLAPGPAAVAHQRGRAGKRHLLANHRIRQER